MSAPATPLPHRSALPSPAAPSLSDPAVSSSVRTAGKSPASAAGSRAGAAAPGVRSAAASAVNGNPSAHESARSQDEAGKLLYSEAAHNPMLSTRPQTPAHSSSEASIEMAASSQRERHLRPISTDFDSAAAVVKSEPDVAPPSTGLIDPSHLSASDPTYVPSYFDLSGSGVSAGSLATPHSDSLSPTQMTPKHGSEGAATLPQTPASATFPFGYGYSVAAPTAVPSGEYAMSVPSLNQAGPTVYNSALESVESNHSAYGYNLAAYPQTVDYGMSKEYVSQNSLGLAMGIGSTMAQQAMNTFNQQFIASSNWSTQPSTTTYVAPATIQPSPERNAVRSASPLQALSPTPSDSDDESENNAPYGIQPLSAPANASGGFAAQQDMSTFDASGSARSGRRSTLHGSQIRPQASQQASPAPRRSTRRRSSVGVSLGSAGGAATSFSDGTFSGRRKHLTLDEDERERYEREAFERDEWRLKEMEEFEHGPLRGNRKERRRMQNRLAQRSFRARSKIQNQEAINHMQHLEALTEAQQTRLTRMQELMERLQRENAALKSERWAVIQQAGALGVKMPEGLGNFSVGPTTVDTATAHGDDHRGHHSFHLHAATFGLATMEA